jgi:phosphatidylglycerol:prolipoprotein diacylglycerol transferase
MYPHPIIFGIGLYEILLTLALLVALFLADKMGMMRGFSVKLQKLLILGFIVAVVCALFGAVFFQAIYNALKTGEFRLQGAGMTFYGGLIFGVAAFLGVWFGVGRFYCPKGEPKEKFGALADMAACLIPLSHGLGRLGCFTAGCCHGKVTSKWYGVTMYTREGWQKVVPVQLFEAIFLFALAGVLLWLFFGKFGKENKGRFPLLPIYCIGYGLWRFCIEYARADERGQTVVSFLTPSQLIAVLMIAAGVVYVFIWLKSCKKATRNIEE